MTFRYSLSRQILCHLLLILVTMGCQPISPSLPTSTQSGQLPLPTLPTLATPLPATHPDPSLIVLVNGNLIDGTGAEPILDAVVVIRGERIQAIGKRASVAIPPDARVIDLQGGTILPGFFNAHVHGAFNLEKLAAWAQAGVTTVRDLGARTNPPPYDIRSQASRDQKYARLVSAGVFITKPGGYPTIPWGGPAVKINTPEEARKAAVDMLDQGADLIKISLESGQIFNRDIPILTTAEVRAIVDEAHQRGTRVSVHVSISKDLALALEGGVDDIAHMVTDELPDDLIARMVEQGVYWEPTLELWKNVGQGLDSKVIDNLMRYVQAGGRVALGTDFGGYTTPFQLGMPIKEIEWMSEAGMTPLQIITAATHNAAVVSDLDHELVTLEAGKIADLFIVGGNPLEDLQTLEQVQWVIHSGQIIRQP